MSGKFGDRLMYIGGQFVPGHGGQWIESVNPGTEEVHGRVPVGTVEDVHKAVLAAEAAQPEHSVIAGPTRTATTSNATVRSAAERCIRW